MSSLPHTPVKSRRLLRVEDLDRATLDNIATVLEKTQAVVQHAASKENGAAEHADLPMAELRAIAAKVEEARRQGRKSRLSYFAEPAEREVLKSPEQLQAALGRLADMIAVQPLQSGGEGTRFIHPRRLAETWRQLIAGNSQDLGELKQEKIDLQGLTLCQLIAHGFQETGHVRNER